MCHWGDREPEICPPGHYCLVGENEATPCPAGFWQPDNGTYTRSQCLICEPGYECYETGISDLTGYECPVGHYCTEGTVDAYPCPKGTFWNSTEFQADNYGDCNACPAGHYCPEGTIDPIRCSDGEYC